MSGAEPCLGLVFDGPPADGSWFAYRLAGHTVVSDVAVPALAAFALPRSTAPVVPLPPCARSASSAGEKRAPAAALSGEETSPAMAPRGEESAPVMTPAAEPIRRRRLHHGRGWVAGCWREVECWHDSGGYRLEVEGIGSFHVDERGTWGCRLTGPSTGPEGASGPLVEAMLGPVLVLALALRGSWCLHAAAVALGDRAIAFVGESGSGKSTLAAHLASANGSPVHHLAGAPVPSVRQLICAHGSPVRHLADDMLPVGAGEGGIDALPRFPQLKLPATAQPGAAAPERLPLGAVYCLVPPDGATAEVDIRPLWASDAALAFVRHSVAARLFGEELLAEQLTFCARASELVPVRELRHPRSWEALPTVAQCLLADLTALAPSGGMR